MEEPEQIRKVIGESLQCVDINGLANDHMGNLIRDNYLRCDQ